MFHRMSIGDAQQAALSFLRSQVSHIEATAFLIKYPDIQYPQLVPVDTSAPEWAKSITYISVDQAGRAEFIHGAASDIPLADVTREQHEVGVEMAGIGYRYNLEELGQAMMLPGVNLSADRASAARRAAEEFIDDVVWNGKADKGWSGLLNYPGITAVNAPADGGSGNSPAFKDKTPDQVLRDINAILTGIYTSTLTTELADTLLMPVEVFADLATRRLTDTGMTILQFLMQFNVYTAQTGQPLTIRTVRGLETAGSGGTGRIIAYRRDPDVLKFHMPMPHRFLPVWQSGPMRFDVPGIMRLSGLEIRRPGAVRYMDLVLDAPYE